MFQTPHFVTGLFHNSLDSHCSHQGNFKSYAFHLQDEEYSRALDCIVKGIRESFINSPFLKHAQTY